MPKVVKHILLGFLLSCYFFPFQFKFIPVLNTKMMCAACGLVYFIFHMKNPKKTTVSNDVLVSFVFALIFSLWCYLASVMAHVNDNSYATYFISFFVWIFGAYFVCQMFRQEYGTVDVKTITIYLTIVAVVQCILAELFCDIPALKSAVDSVVEQGQAFLNAVNRRYGIGSSLDNGGVRFATILILLSYLIVVEGLEKGSGKTLWVLYLSFIIITVFGNMIARTTTVGALVGIVYIIWMTVARISPTIKRSRIQSSIIGALVLGIAISAGTYLFNSDSSFESSMRFAFEGFFNWAETGEFSTASTNKLNDTMWIWPTNRRDWWLGTGQFGNWVFGTDIGYCRFVLYCGIIGLSLFTLFFIHNSAALARKFGKDFTLAAIAIFVLQLGIWIKVSTDIFQIYALLLSIDSVIINKEPEAGEEMVPKKRKMRRIYIR